MKCDPLEPRVFLSAVKVMPLGDSITEGWPGPERVTYRFWLWKRLELAGYDVDFVGSRTGVSSGQPLYTDWDQNHQGLSGWTADEVAAQATSWANAAQPDIVLLHIGTNDLLQSQSVSGTINEVKQIIDNLRVARPNVDIFLCKIIPSTINASAFVNFNNQIPGVVAEKDTQQSRVIMVDQFTGFSATNDEFDGIHPNARGERKMSTKFYAGLTSAGRDVPQRPELDVDDERLWPRGARPERRARRRRRRRGDLAERRHLRQGPGHACAFGDRLQSGR
jgi:lysophospholipase L1-like esterase